MTPDEARTLLGVRPDATRPEIEAALRYKSAESRARTPVDDAQLARLREARELLTGHRPEPAGLLARTQMFDIPRVGPPGAAVATAAPPPSLKPPPLPPDLLAQIALRGPELNPGQVLANRFEIRKEVGRGGMGVVYAAHDRTRGHEVALKLLLPALLRGRQARARFGNEVAATARLSHPRIVRVYDVHEAAGYTFMSMELLRGATLRQEMNRRRAEGRTFEPYEVQRIAELLCDALQYAHSRGIVHRDVKPENIWLTKDGSLKLMDFGIARLLTPALFRLTGAGLGTAYYAAPEQVRGAADVDGRADQYAVGVVMYELLTGELPQGAVLPPHERRRDVPPVLSRAIMRALAGWPDERHRDMARLKAALHEPESGVPKRTTLAVLAAAVVLGVGAAILSAAGAFSDADKDPAGDGSVTEKRESARTASPAAAASAGPSATQTEAMEARKRAQAARDQMEADLAVLPLNACPPELREAEGYLTDAETLIKSRDYARAADRADKAKAMYDHVRPVIADRRKQYEATQDVMRAMTSSRERWEKIAAGVPPAELPEEAARAEVRAGVARAKLAAGNLTDANAQAEEAGRLFQRANEALTQKLRPRMDEARGRAEPKVRAVADLRARHQALFKSTDERYKAAAERLARATGDRDKALTAWFADVDNGAKQGAYNNAAAECETAEKEVRRLAEEARRLRFYADESSSFARAVQAAVDTFEKAEATRDRPTEAAALYEKAFHAAADADRYDKAYSEAAAKSGP